MKLTLQEYNKLDWDSKEALPAKTKQAFEKENAIAYLKKALKNNTQVYTVLRHVSSSGMSRRMSCFIAKNGAIEDITFYVARILETKRHKNDGGITVSGCGMDMGFHLVYSLSTKVYGNDSKGAYTLKQSWI